MPLDDINYAVTTSTFYFMNARGMQAAKNPPKAKMKATPRTQWTIKDQDSSCLPSLQAAGLPCHPVTLLLGPQKHAVSAMQ